MPAAISLAPDLWRIPTMRWDLINSYLLRNTDGSLTLVDTGLKSAPARILAALTEVGADPTDVTSIVLTHAHFDHAGGAAHLARVTKQGMTAHPEDAEFVRSGTSPPTDRSLALGRLIRRTAGSDPAPVALTMADGELLPDSLLRVHHTPGHTPGHCSLVHEPSRTLITGDAIFNMRARRTWPMLAFCTNAQLTKETAHTLADLEYDAVAFTHGPEIREAGRDAIRAFLSQPRRFAPGL